MGSKAKKFEPNEYDSVLFSVDPVILTMINGHLNVLLVKREQEPEKDRWALPGGRVDKKNCDDLDAAVKLKLRQKTGLDHAYAEQAFTEGGSDMDPRGWSLTTVYISLLCNDDIDLSKNDTGEEVAWYPVKKLDELGPLAFWHNLLIERALSRLRDKVVYTDLPMRLMPEEFTIHELRQVYEEILSGVLARPSFFKRMTTADILVDTGRKKSLGSRPAALYRYKNRSKTHIFPGMLEAKREESMR